MVVSYLQGLQGLLQPSNERCCVKGEIIALPSVLFSNTSHCIVSHFLL